MSRKSSGTSFSSSSNSLFCADMNLLRLIMGGLIVSVRLGGFLKSIFDASSDWLALGKLLSESRLDFGNDLFFFLVEPDSISMLRGSYYVSAACMAAATCA